ncbi:hypothetical protein SD70_20415 [Gordoniibacillus kamchatkensis]|uniref:Uncharacterized protein n=1 Tax=Gordoniibacillus kamchatkensis TaxID=1590651 RepID=A0ABR5AED5_9BACL|nr:hypothetical protein SD70_20415 [Paenibacillus sp. VKM B-2647]
MAMEMYHAKWFQRHVWAAFFSVAKMEDWPVSLRCKYVFTRPGQSEKGLAEQRSFISSFPGYFPKLTERRSAIAL